MAKSKDVVALLRVSTADQAADDRAGLGRQREVIKRTVLYRGLNCLREIELRDVSGTNVRNCPEILDILDEVRRGKIQGLVVADLDRLVRPANIEELALLQVFQDTGAIIYSGDQEIDLSSDSGYLMGGIQALLAGHELRLIKRRMQGAKEVRRREGKCPGGKITLPTGVSYDQATEKYSYTADVAKVVEAFRMIDEDGVRNLCAIARAVGLQNRTLANLLRNPIYTGFRVYTQKRGAKYPSKNGRQSDRKKVARADSEIIRVKVIETPAVPQERFDRIQQVLSNVKSVWSTPRKAGGEVRLGVGIVRCGCCGGLLFCSSGKRRGRPKSYGYYHCKSNYYLYKTATGGCPQPNLRQEDVDEALGKLVSGHLADEKVVEAILSAQQEDRGCGSVVDDVSAKAVENKRSELKRKRTRLLTAYEDGAIDLPTYRQRTEQLDAELKTLEKASLQTADVGAKTLDYDTRCRAIVRGALAFARVSTASQRRAVLTKMFAEITVGAEGIKGFRLMPQFHVDVAENGIPLDKGSSRRPG